MFRYKDLLWNLYLVKFIVIKVLIIVEIVIVKKVIVKLFCRVVKILVFWKNLIYYCKVKFFYFVLYLDLLKL